MPPEGADGKFLHRTEGVLELHAGPHGPRRPVACFDECGKGLHGHVAGPPPPPGHPAKEGYGRTRHGAAGLLVAVGPSAGKRQATATDRRTIPDFAARTKRLCDVPYPAAAVIRAASGDLNTHVFGSPFAASPPDEAWRPARRLEFHYTPKHASWLNVAECELSVLSRQCSNRRLSDKGKLSAEVAAWVADRNRAKSRLVRSFRVADARRKLSHLYPKELQR